MKPKLIVMVGLQGSGKSTVAKEIFKTYKKGPDKYIDLLVSILSSDKYRKENPSWNNDQVFKQLYEDMNRDLAMGIDVILDATNITLKSRKKIFENLKIDCEKIAYVMNETYETCVERVEKRNESGNSHIVPLDAVEKYWISFQCPAKFEGFDEVILHNYNSINDVKYMGLLSKMYGFNQNNPNHSLTLGAHSYKVYKNVIESLGFSFDDFDDETNKIPSEILEFINGVDLHDIGKLFTRVPNKKDPSYDSYYSHAEIGAYFKICNGWTPEEVKYETYHMHPYQWKTEKAHEKWKKIFGEEFYNNLLILNQCDIEAH